MRLPPLTFPVTFSAAEWNLLLGSLLDAMEDEATAGRTYPRPCPAPPWAASRHRWREAVRPRWGYSGRHRGLFLDLDERTDELILLRM